MTASPSRTFASDNYAGVHPEVLAALTVANVGHETAYGEDSWTARLRDVLSRHFGRTVDAYPTFNGTGANVVALQAMLPRWGAVVCASTAHIATDEAGAPEKVAGIKLLTVDTPDGKLTPQLIDQQAWGWGEVHRSQPLVVSITQTTEFGTCYTPAEIRAITEHAHERGMFVHLDGARLSNAAAHLGTGLAEFTADAGVDVVSLGGTKNGALGAEAVVVLNPEAVSGVDYIRKLSMQLASKMRFVSAQLVALYEGDLWLRSAQHANAMAALLRSRLDEAVAAGDLPGVRVTQATESNALFVILPAGVADRVRERFRFYDWNEATGEVRWMCSFDTTEQDVADLIETVRDAIRQR